AGIEKTFLDSGRASVEVRVPFAATVRSDLLADGFNGEGAELGNVHVTLKALLYEGDCVNVASGLGVALPTADDVRVGLSERTTLVRFRNQALILEPYLAVLVTPCDRIFTQAWATVGFDSTGSPVDANPFGRGLQGVGRLNEQALLQLDAQVGCWLMRPDRA